MGAFLMPGGGYQIRFMRFIDGTNFLIQMKKELKICFSEHKPGVEEIKAATAWVKALPITSRLHGFVVRNYWICSYEGDDNFKNGLIHQLRECEFEPVLLKKIGNREKGVDLSLAKEMLVNAFNKNFDLGLLVAGDEDYVGIVNEVKRYGQIINGSFFNSGLSELLKNSFDEFILIKKEKSTIFETEALKQLEIKHSTKFFD
jgi:uncharacterized LabA/DUF88 family protein